MTQANAPHLRLVRWNEHEVILFDDARRESWLVYPPGSQYVSRKHVLDRGTLVERRRWTPYDLPEEHLFTMQTGCAKHGMDCEAQKAIQAAIDYGWNPF
jgi:hypothetical protein